MLRHNDIVFGSLLAVTAEFCTNKELFEALFDTVREKLPEEVPNTTLLLWQHNGVTMVSQWCGMDHV